MHIPLLLYYKEQCFFVEKYPYVPTLILQRAIFFVEKYAYSPILILQRAMFFVENNEQDSKTVIGSKCGLIARPEEGVISRQSFNCYMIQSKPYV